MIYNDADIEMIELAAQSDEDDAETCRKCGEMYQSITIYQSPRGERPRREEYECICGHRSLWINGRRQS